ncbi:2TM domain-containing protein [Candidatus Bealeia paramacronuclearis]|uniref:2TM domain-containing protein n=2 Tax=Candidatus Bealeia paramacronuclearis TaxID=1921001 RepID=A0ABZ2C3U1_9PROT|nr:2TM domain-containing protein [Candidatus Bealeia paramacronuclearis]
MDKDQAQEIVRRKREFYVSLTVYIIFSIVGTIIFFLYDHGMSFWPKYIYFWGALYIVYKGIKTGSLPFISSILPFTSQKWEQKEVDKLTKKNDLEEKK